MLYQEMGSNHASTLVTNTTRTRLPSAEPPWPCPTFIHVRQHRNQLPQRAQNRPSLLSGHTANGRAEAVTAKPLHAAAVFVEPLEARLLIAEHTGAKRGDASKTSWHGDAVDVAGYQPVGEQAGDGFIEVTGGK